MKLAIQNKSLPQYFQGSLADSNKEFALPRAAPARRAKQGRRVTVMVRIVVTRWLGGESSTTLDTSMKGAAAAAAFFLRIFAA
jgi:hypothetical protein